MLPCIIDKVSAKNFCNAYKPLIFCGTPWDYATKKLKLYLPL